MFVNGMSAAALGPVAWVKAARSNSGGNCVQFAVLPGGRVGVRDSKDPQGPALVFGSGEVAAFVGALKAGAYDGLLADG